MKRKQAGCKKEGGIFRPFEKLRDILDGQSLGIRPSDPSFNPPKSDKRRLEDGKRKTEEELFREAMADVTPIAQAKRHIGHLKKAGTPIRRDTCEKRVLYQLERLVDCGEGFEVAHTPEYMEGRGYNVSREVTRRLYNGDFSIQGHIDLHGLNVMDARDAFLGFMEAAIANGRRAVLIVHGRGLSSPVEPVLKGKVFSWLTRSAIRKWVIAFTSARSCDGGAGATYVLLRLRPVTKRYRKNWKKSKGKPPFHKEGFYRAGDASGIEGI